KDARLLARALAIASRRVVTRQHNSRNTEVQHAEPAGLEQAATRNSIEGGLDARMRHVGSPGGMQSRAEDWRADQKACTRSTKDNGWRPGTARLDRLQFLLPPALRLLHSAGGSQPMLNQTRWLNCPAPGWCAFVCLVLMGSTAPAAAVGPA